MKPAIKITMTLVFGVLLCLLFWYLFNPLKDSTRLEQLRYIGPSAGRMMDRHLGFYEGYEEVGVLEATLHEFLFGSRKEVQNKAIHVYEEVLAFLQAHPDTAKSWDILNTKARWLISIAEFRSHAELEKALLHFDNNPEEEVIAEAVKYAYFDDYHERFSPEVYTGATMIPDGWAKNRLRLRINTRLDKPYFIKLFGDRLRHNGERLRRHVLQMTLAIVLVVISGIYIMFRYRIFYIPPPWRSRLLDRPWSLLDGLFVAIPSAVLGLTIWLVAHWLSGQYFNPRLVSQWSTVFASIPMLLFIHYALLKPRGMNLISAFGLSLRGVRLRNFLALTGALLALEMIGLMFIGWGTWKLGLDNHWAQGIQERLVFGPTETVIFSMINIVIWTPIFEEIGFRGLLYTTFRARFTPTVAMVISAALFSALHLKSLSGFLSIFWSGLILAYAYEKYRSLLPGMLIHGAGNLLYLSTILLFYR